MREPATGSHTPAYATPDLTTCDREPIHVPGAIQPHGLLLALDDGHRIVVASSNCATLLGTPAGELAGQHVLEVLGPSVSAEIVRVLRDNELRTPVRVTMSSGGSMAGVEVDMLVHLSGLRIIVELEPVDGPATTQQVSYRSARTAVTRLTQTTSTADLCRRLALEIRQLTGFDRVMVYRFDADWNGEVVAEERRDDLNPFLGLHYPATDIPAQARRLYTVNWTRLIADISYEPVELVPLLDPGTAAPLDLSYSVLRSVSPIHVEYLSNMGVTASMSVSMVKDGELWGLVACHHYSGPHRVGHDARSAAEFLGETASQLIDDRERSDRRGDELRAGVLLSRMTADLAGDPRPVYDTLLADPRLLDLVSARGAALWVDDTLLTTGEVPSESALHAIASYVSSPDGRAVSSDHLAAISPELADVATQAAGALHIGNGPDRWLMWLRPELEQTVDWGGDPTNKALAAAEGAGVRLSPRKSFAKWRQVVRGRSEPWEAWHLELAETLRQHLSSELLRRSREHVAIVESLQRTMVLDEAPTFDGIDVMARYRPAQGSQLGGDWWDAFTLPDGRVAVTVGDVAGHGVTAATAMAQIRTALRAYMLDGHSAAACVDRLDQLVLSLLPGRTATVVLVLIDPGTGVAEVASAGHPPVLLVRAGTSRALEHANRPLLGVGVGSTRSESLELEPGDCLLLYSDGLVERRGRSIDDSIARLLDASAAGPTDGDLSAWVDDLLTAVPGTMDDDLTIVAVRMPPLTGSDMN